MASVRPDVTFELGRVQPETNSVRFETFPDVSRKLDTILQLLQGPNGLAALNGAIGRLNTTQAPLAQAATPIVSMDQGNYGSGQFESSLMKQKWGEIGMQPRFGSAYVDPITAMQAGTMSWSEGCTSCPNQVLTPQTLVPTMSAPSNGPSLSQADLDQAMTKSNQMLEQIFRRVSAPRVETRTASSPMPDMTHALFTINEEISGIRQLLSVRPEQGPPVSSASSAEGLRSSGIMMTDLRQSLTDNSEEIVGRLDQLQTSLQQYNDLLHQIYDAVSQLVGQANDNTTMIQDVRTNSSGLRQTLGEVNSLLIQNINHRGSDIQQLMEENASLRAHVQKLVDVIEGEPKKSGKR